jgi:hypothetical protein
MYVCLMFCRHISVFSQEVYLMAKLIVNNCEALRLIDVKSAINMPRYLSFQLTIIISVYYILQRLNMDDAKQKAML